MANLQFDEVRLSVGAGARAKLRRDRGRRRAHHGHQVALTTDLDAHDAEARLGAMESDAFDDPGKVIQRIDRGRRLIVHTRDYKGVLELINPSCYISTCGLAHGSRHNQLKGTGEPA
jgi:hypothetical protein